jgi:hypothetical protein
MVRRADQSQPDFEDFLAELTDAAYRAVLPHGLRGSFLDTQLALWRDLRGVLQSKWDSVVEREREAGRWSAWQEPPAKEEQGVLVRRSR